MASKTYDITQYLVSPPAASGFGIFSFSSPLYAKIECWGAAGETMVLEYLRPDTISPFDLAVDGGPLPNQYDAVKDVARVFRFAHQFRWDRDLLASGRQIVARVDDQNPALLDVFAPVELLAQTAKPVPDVLQWLGQRPNVADAMLWQEPGILPLRSFPQWTTQQKQDLVSAFAAAWNSVPSTLQDPPPSLTNDPSDVVISAANAWGLYLEHVAHSLTLEISGAVPWSLTQLVQDDRFRVLSAGEMYSETGGNYWVTRNVPASPWFVYSFLRRYDLVGASRFDTIVRLLTWCRRYLRHFWDDPNWAQVHWQYPGVPDRRILEGTVATGYAQYGQQHWTAGCGGTSNFLKNVLRVVNIPAERIALPAGHITIRFTSEGRWLCHGDDPYSLGVMATPEIPAAEMLIDQATFQSWFGPAVSSGAQLRNVDRRTSELVLQYLPDHVLHLHWQDRNAGRAPVDSRVYKGYFQSLYPNVNAISSLWPAMDKKMADFGRMTLAILMVRLPLWFIRFLPPWVPVLLQRIPLLWIPNLVRVKKDAVAPREIQ
jgi:hypothetical protein